MAEGPRLVTVGTTNGGATAIQADVTSLGSDVPVAVTLLSNYVLVDPQPIGFPARASHTGAHAANLHFPRTLLAGSVIFVLQCEASALVAAGAAELA